MDEAPDITEVDEETKDKNEYDIKNEDPQNEYENHICRH